MTTSQTSGPTIAQSAAPFGSGNAGKLENVPEGVEQIEMGAQVVSLPPITDGSKHYQRPPTSQSLLTSQFT